MKTFYLLTFLLCFRVTFSQVTIDEYFEKIRNNNATLTAFFSQMPKGGDLHHHYSGSVYAETYWEFVVREDYWINESTLKVVDKIEPAPKKRSAWKKLSAFNPEQLSELRFRIIKLWSIKDYNDCDEPGDKHFFSTFPNFSVASGGDYEKGLSELKSRAMGENVQYIETMFTSISCNVKSENPEAVNSLLRRLRQSGSDQQLTRVLDSLSGLFEKKNIHGCADEFNAKLKERHHRLGIDDQHFTMRYQNYVLRTLDPVRVFRDLLIAFYSADKSELIVGVNIVAPEDNEVSMKDYGLHMRMFKYCHEKYPGVKFSMHAGELTLGLVKPEELTWHISEAVKIAKAGRIGHGVDIAYEKDCFDLLNNMRENKIAIEINLFSNEFILKVKDRAHPVTLYKDFNVPIVICTDDAGVLRSNLTHQFVLLAERYPEVKYTDIKKFILNSIDFSFIEEVELKTKLRENLVARLNAFEHGILGNSNYPLR